MMQTKNEKHKPETVANRYAVLRLDGQRENELLDIATEVFLEYGFNAASTNDIANRAHCSKTTLYTRYPTKKQLFIAVIERQMQKLFGQFEAAVSCGLPIRQTLIRYGLASLELCLSEKHRELIKIISLESSKFPELGQQFNELGPARRQRFLQAYFKDQIQSGLLREADPALMAEQWWSLIFSEYMTPAFLGASIDCSAGLIRRRVEAAIDVFLRAYAPVKHNRTQKD
jgi:TetR/AcrR family transcriptional repressor of mexJK operon